MFKKIIFDIETNGLLEALINFTTKPLSLKDTAKLWCVSVRCVKTNKSAMLIPDEYFNNEELLRSVCEDDEEFKAVKALNLKPLSVIDKVFKHADEIIGHNIIKFDLVALKLFGAIDYEIGYPELKNNTYKTTDTLFGRPVKFVDTHVWSQLLWADRFGGHSLKNFGNKGFNSKLDFEEFDKFSGKMLIYCDRDTLVNKDAYNTLMQEKGYILESTEKLNIPSDAFELPYRVEAKIADLAIRQELHGFYYDRELSERNKIELEKLLEERHSKVTPELPPKPLNKGEAKDVTPPVRRTKKDGSLSSYMIKFLDKVGGSYNPLEGTFTVGAKTFPLDHEGPVVDSLPASIKDLDHVKGYLISLGWEPSEWKERDLTVDSKKQKRTEDGVMNSIANYVEKTYFLPYTKHRLEFLGLPPETTPEELTAYLVKRYKDHPKKGIKVLGAPNLRIGAEKVLCPNLEKIAFDHAIEDQDSFTKNITEYYTYQHRMNSICGNVDEETGEAHSGFESNVRSNSTIPTVLFTNATATCRMKHSVVDVYRPHSKQLSNCWNTLRALYTPFYGDIRGIVKVIVIG